MFLVQRADAVAFDLARDIDPRYGRAFDLAVAAGVEVLAYRCRLTPEEITIEDRIPLRTRAWATTV